jgi:tetratricopeptide (TPR) repeat protein
MKKMIYLGLISLLLAMPLVVAAAGEKADKIPTTTTSKEALELYLKGRDLQDRLQGQESLQLLQQAVAKDPNFAMALVYLAGAQPTTAGFFEYLDKAVQLVDKVSEGERLFILAADAGAKGQALKQIDYLTRLVLLFPKDERAHNQLSLAYFGQQDWKKAMEESKKAVEINPNFSTPYNQLGYAYRFLGDFSGAEKAFKKYTELIPNDPNPYDSYAELLLKMGRFDESIALYRKALQQNSHFVASMTGIALNLNLKGDYKGAQDELKKLYDLARTDAERRLALFNTASSYIFEGKPDLALGELQKEYDLDSRNKDDANMAGDLAAMSTIYLELNNPGEAAKNYEQSLKTIEGSSLAKEVKENTRRNNIYNLARVELVKGNLKSACELSAEYGKSVQAANNPNQMKLTHQLNGMIALEAKEWDTAIKELQQAPFDFNPDNYYRLGLAFEGKGDKAKAKENYLKAAHFNGLDGLNVSFYHNRALKKLEKM